jgi:hypothetical protein
MGSTAAITAKVARMVGLPTSPTASTAMVDQAGPVLGKMKVADDVFDHHDGVIDEDADREDQGEEGDAVEGEAVEVEDQQRQRERRDGDAPQCPIRASPG